MYKDIILLLIIICIFYSIYKPDNNIYIKATNDTNGSEYKVAETPNSDLKANMLYELDSKIKILIKHLYDNKLPNEEISNRLSNKMQKIELREIPINETGAGYTINKGHIYLCLYNKDKNEMNNIDDVMFVLLHEIAHTMSISYGHGKEFKSNFDYIVKLAVKLELWNKKDYSKDNIDICGVNVTNGNCDNGECEKDKLEYFFKESLLDYK